LGERISTAITFGGGTSGMGLGGAGFGWVRVGITSPECNGDSCRQGDDLYTESDDRAFDVFGGFLEDELGLLSSGD
jgi:hypothetical protein